MAQAEVIEREKLAAVGLRNQVASLNEVSQGHAHLDLKPNKPNPLALHQGTTHTSHMAWHDVPMHTWSCQGM